MLFYAATSNPNKQLVILAQAVMPKEDYDNWKYFLKHFRDSGLGSNIQFIMSNDIVLEDILPPNQEVKRGRKRKNNI